MDADNYSAVRRITGLLAIASASAFAVCSCGFSEPPKQLKVFREVPLERGNGGITPAVISATKDGGFIVAGSGPAQTVAWATRVAADGKLVWRHLDSDPRGSTPMSSTFRGVLMLSDDTTLLCGSKQLPHRKTGLLTHVAADGQVIEKRTFFPAVDDEQLFIAEFSKCVPWNDGFALVGGVWGSPKGGLGWLIKLKASGDLEWDIVSPDLPLAADVMEAPDHSLVVAGLQPKALHAFDVVRVNSQGKVQATREMVRMEGQHLILLQPFVSKTTLNFLLAGDYRTVLYTMDFNFKDLRSPRAMPAISAKSGYLLPDQSFVVFGHVMDSFTSAAAIQWINRAGMATVREFAPVWSTDQPTAIWDTKSNPRYIVEVSNDVDAGLILSATQFVAVRNRVGKTDDQLGLVMDWVSIESQ